MDRSIYSEVRELNSEHGIYLVKNDLTGEIFVRKILDSYNKSIFEFIQSHPIDGIPKIIDLYEENEFLIVIEEYINGRTIKEMLDTDGPFSDDVIVFYVKKLCLTLKELHSLNPSIIHRDIKPSNVIITDTNQAVLIDFDAAKVALPWQNKDTVLLGTEGYAAPEQYGFGASGIQTDIYGLGQLMHVMITNNLDTPVPNSSSLKSIIDKCCELNPKDRYSSASELYGALSHSIKKSARIITMCIACILIFLLILPSMFIYYKKSTATDFAQSSPANTNTTKSDDIDDNDSHISSDRMLESDYSIGANEVAETSLNIHSPIGVYSGDYGELLLITDRNLAYYYCKSVEFTELSCPWTLNEDSISIDFSKMHCTVTASVKSNDYSVLTFKSKSSNWNTEIFTKIADDYSEYYLSPPPSSSSVVNVLEDGTMQFYIADMLFTIPKNFVDYGDMYQSHGTKMFTDTDATYNYSGCTLFCEENVNTNPNMEQNHESLLNDFCYRFINNLELSSSKKTYIAGKTAYCSTISGTLNDGFSELNGTNIHGNAYVIYDDDSSELIYILQIQTPNSVLDDNDLFEYIINEAKTIS